MSPRWSWAALLLVGGCCGRVEASNPQPGGNSSGDPAPPPDCSGAWYVTATEKPGGSCGAIADAIADGLGPRSLPCDPMRGSMGEPLQGCEGPATLMCYSGSTTVRVIADIEPAGDGSYAGSESVTVTGADGATICSSEYALRFRRN